MKPLLLVPVKRLDLAKSRLEVAPDRRRAIARLLVEQTLSIAGACVGVGGFAVVTADEEVKVLVESRGGLVIHDPRESLNGALAAALDVLRCHAVERSVLVLVADLPCLTEHELDSILTVVERSAQPRMIRDLTGIGTTSVSLPPGRSLSLTFGPSSANRFCAAGFVPIEDAPYGARADLDTTDDLVLMNRRRAACGAPTLS
jgi:2-phospho-L-lactate/phosphoenolpyruvate guanylyltransferase